MAAKVRVNREALNGLRMTAGFTKKLPCTSKENAEYAEMRKNGEELPEGIYRDSDSGYSAAGYGEEYYRVQESDLTEKEREEYLALLRVKRLQSINRHLIFYTTLIILYIAVRVLLVAVAGGSIASLLR